MTRRIAGVLLSEAAALTLRSQRLAVAALITMEEAEASTADLSFIVGAEIKPVDVAALCEALSVLAENLLRLAHAYGHAGVGRHASRLEGA